jgi:hypothetical protein
MSLRVVNDEIIKQMQEQIESLALELQTARELLKRTWWLPAEGSTVAVYRVIDEETNEAIVQYLTLLDVERYVPKKERK